MAIWISLIAGLLAAIYAIVEFSRRFCRSLEAGPELPVASAPDPMPRVSVIIPAYNEAENIQECMEAVLASELPDRAVWDLWVADDQSTDNTLMIATQVAAAHPQAHVVAVPPRPRDQRWMGKNWACTYVVENCIAPLIAEPAKDEFFLFIDADVRLKPQAIASAIVEADRHQADLLSCTPRIVCGCFAEWLAQPLIAALLVVGFDFQGVNDPQQRDVAFASGPFMLFRRSSYEQIGGHRAIASTALEDVELARRIKQKGYRLRWIPASQLMTVRMYRSFAGLWEGWTKNFHLGSQRKLSTSLYIVLIMVLIGILPWLGGLGLLLWPSQPMISAAILGLTLLAIGLQYRLRWLIADRLQIPMHYGGLTGLGAALVAAIAMTSIIKTETGWGWTWRGRPLSLPLPSQNVGR